MRRLAMVLFVLGLALPAAARADGGPVLPVQGGSGVGVPGDAARYVALRVPGGTLLELLRRGSVDSTRIVGGDLGVPGAAFDGSTTGLSADGRTLVLAGLQSRYPQRRTALAVLDTRRLRVRERLSLPGFFTVDAISPDGRRLYLIHYANASNILRYEVRAYDLAGHRLLAKPIVDPREPGEKMLGIPFSRVVSPDGRWAYTLYARPQGEPFIHALDTRAGTAACIDLDGLVDPGDASLRLIPPRGDGPLVVASPAGAQRLVDRRTFAVSNPPAREQAADDGGGPPWGLAAALAVLALIAVAAARHALVTRRGRLSARRALTRR